MLYILPKKKANDIANDFNKTNHDQKFASANDGGVQSMASSIVNKVKETAETVKEKVGNILQGVTGESAKEKEQFEERTNDIPYAKTATSDNSATFNANTNTFDQSNLNKDKKDTKQTVSHQRHHPDPDTIGHASS